MDQNRVENQVDEGTLQIHLTNASTGIPVKGAKISISYTGGPQQVLEEVDTDDSGNTEKITLDAPPLEYSMEPGENQPYAEYTIKVHATGYRDITVSAINILSGEDATQEVVMEAQDAPGNPIDTIVIDAHTLYGEYPPARLHELRHRFFRNRSLPPDARQAPKAPSAAFPVWLHRCFLIPAILYILCHHMTR